jgi:hypothetical protein
MAAGDSSYSPCCVDEVEAEHASSDAIVHFGASCLTRFFALHLCDMKSEPDCATETQSCRCIVCLADANSTLLTLPRLSRSVFRTQVLSFSLSLSLYRSILILSSCLSAPFLCIRMRISIWLSICRYVSLTTAAKILLLYDTTLASYYSVIQSAVASHTSLLLPPIEHAWDPKAIAAPTESKSTNILGRNVPLSEAELAAYQVVWIGYSLSLPVSNSVCLRCIERTTLPSYMYACVSTRPKFSGTAPSGRSGARRAAA